MLDTTEIALFAGLGLLFAVGLIVLAHWSKIRPARLAAFALIAVSFIYVGFAIRAENPETWVGFEMTGVAVFATLAGMTIIGSPWFVIAGLALHPIWALYVHYRGAGSAFAPAPFAIANASFDIAAALYIAFVFWKDQRAAKNTAPAQSGAARGRKGAGK